MTGAPCTGKSTFAARFVLEHPEFRYCPIDEYRIQYEDENLAWSELTRDIIDHRHCVIESCGMNWRLGDLFNLSTIRKRKILTVELIASEQILTNRLSVRHKRPLPPPFRPEDEVLTMRHVLEYYDVDKVIDTDLKLDTGIFSPDQIFSVANGFIMDKLFRNYEKREFRKGMCWTGRRPRRQTTIDQIRDL